jgi:hypothetical protein
MVWSTHRFALFQMQLNDFAAAFCELSCKRPVEKLAAAGQQQAVKPPVARRGCDCYIAEICV